MPLLLLGLISGIATGTAYAADKGTCILASNQDTATQKVATCKSFMPNGKDAQGTKVDASKCYELSESDGSITINKAVSCSNSEFNSKAKTCPDGTKAPGDDTSKCTAAQGNDPGGGKCVVGNESTCPVNQADDCDDSVTGSTSCTDPALSGSNVECTKTSCDLVTKYINPLITLLSALVGIAVTISIIIGGIQYGSSAGDPQKVGAAKNRIRNSIIALVAFLFLYSFLQFLVPGGIFNR